MQIPNCYWTLGILENKLSDKNEPQTKRRYLQMRKSFLGKYEQSLVPGRAAAAVVVVAP